MSLGFIIYIYTCISFPDGKFGAMMQVSLVNDGPVTITLESPKSPQIDPEI